jgi:phage baseplate assembly protein W
MANTLNKKAGPAFPFQSSIYGVIGNKARRDSIRTSLFLILTTPKESIPYNLKLGSYVPYLVFEPINDTVINLIYFYTITDIEEQDPRIKILSVSVQVSGPHRLLIQIGYQDRDDPDETPQQTVVQYSRGQ